MEHVVDVEEVQHDAHRLREQQAAVSSTQRRILAQRSVSVAARWCRCAPTRRHGAHIRAQRSARRTRRHEPTACTVGMRRRHAPTAGYDGVHLIVLGGLQCALLDERLAVRPDARRACGDEQRKAQPRRRAQRPAPSGPVPTRAAQSRPHLCQTYRATSRVARPAEQARRRVCACVCERARMGVCVRGPQGGGSAGMGGRGWGGGAMSRPHSLVRSLQHVYATT